MKEEHPMDERVPPHGGETCAERTGLWRMVGAVSRASAPHVHDLMVLAGDHAAFAPLLVAALDPDAGPLRGFGDTRALLEQGAGIEVLRAMKDRAKQGFGPDADGGGQRVAVLAFSLVVGAALRHHGVLTTRADRTTVEDLLLGLCGCHEPWIVELAGRALVRLDALDADGEEDASRAIA
jgi:hypothetical protein